jgi:hypothetical protein
MKEGKSLSSEVMREYQEKMPIKKAEVVDDLPDKDFQERRMKALGPRKAATSPARSIRRKPLPI